MFILVAVFVFVIDSTKNEGQIVMDLQREFFSTRVRGTPEDCSRSKIVLCNSKKNQKEKDHFTKIGRSKNRIHLKLAYICFALRVDFGHPNTCEKL